MAYTTGCEVANLSNFCVGRKSSWLTFIFASLTVAAYNCLKLATPLASTSTGLVGRLSAHVVCASLDASCKVHIPFRACFDVRGGQCTLLCTVGISQVHLPGKTDFYCAQNHSSALAPANSHVLPQHCTAAHDAAGDLFPTCPPQPRAVAVPLPHVSPSSSGWMKSLCNLLLQY